MSSPDLPRAHDLPPWMCTLRDRYLQTETSQFVLHGNVHDVICCAGQNWSMSSFLESFFAPSGKLIVHYDPGRGIWFPNDEHASRAALAFIQSGFIASTTLAPRGVDKASKRALAKRLDHELLGLRRTDVALTAVEDLLSNHGTQCAVIIHYAEMIAPDGSVASLNFDDRTAVARLHRWSMWEEITRGDNLVLMLTGALPDLSRRLTRNPRVGALRVPLPGPLERARFLALMEPGLNPDRGEALTRITAGLQLRQIQDLLNAHAGAQPDEASNATEPRSVFRASAPLPTKAIFQRKKEILEQECAGLIEVIEPKHGFEVVGGMDPIKETLLRIAGHVKAGRTKQVPMGILFVGPMGTGKTFLAEAFAKESGLAAIKLKNFRDKWVGSTESNLEKVLDVIEGLGEILVMIDEGDRSLGGGDADGGVNSRVIARLKEFMSDTTHRGRIIFVMMTNRPDKLDTDIKRPGRFDLKIPFFAPQNTETRASITRAIFRRHKLENEITDEELLKVLEPLEGYAAADLEAIALMAYDDVKTGFIPEGLESPTSILTWHHLQQAASDFMPTRETAMIRFMEMLAIQEASNRRMLPARFKKMSIAEINDALAKARAALPRRPG